jgi:hypothetical protein
MLALGMLGFYKTLEKIEVSENMKKGKKKEFTSLE